MARFDNITLFPAPKPRTEHRSYVLLAVLQLVDVVTTGTILYHHTSAQEANPIVDTIFSTAGLGTGLVVLLALKLMMVYTLWTCQTNVRWGNAIYAVVAGNNILFLALWLLF